MIIFKHRINSIAALDEMPEAYGVELDLRSDGQDIYIHHDAFGKGEKFETWLKHYRHSGLILNTKCEGMEDRILELMEQNGIENYFFLDLSLPFLIRYMNRGLRKIAVRYSEYEPMEFVRIFEGKVDWVWVDCFDGEPVPVKTLNTLSGMFRTCIVSPELQGYAPEKIAAFKTAWQGAMPHAVCTKFPELWK